MSETIYIAGNRGGSFAIGTTGAQSVPLSQGEYDISSSVDIWIRVASFGNVSPERARDVSGSDGYRIFAGNVVTVFVGENQCIGAIAGSAGTLNYHRVS